VVLDVWATSRLGHRDCLGLLITTEPMIAELPKKDSGPAMGGGGMGGMDY
jgi:hypothetical protein